MEEIDLAIFIQSILIVPSLKPRVAGPSDPTREVSPISGGGGVVDLTPLATDIL